MLSTTTPEQRQAFAEAMDKIDARCSGSSGEGQNFINSSAPDKSGQTGSTPVTTTITEVPMDDVHGTSKVLSVEVEESYVPKFDIPMEG